MAGFDAGAPVGSSVHTQCGRHIAIGRLLIDRSHDPLGRVVMRINRARGEQDLLWTSLTPAEARLLAGYLLGQAAAIEAASQELGTD